MKKHVTILGWAVLVAAIWIVGAQPASPSCAALTQPVGHGFGTWLSGCPDDHPVAFYAYRVSNPATTNSAGQDGICEARAPAQNGIGQACLNEAGVSGDG